MQVGILFYDGIEVVDERCRLWPSDIFLKGPMRADLENALGAHKLARLGECVALRFGIRALRSLFLILAINQYTCFGRELALLREDFDTLSCLERVPIVYILIHSCQISFREVPHVAITTHSNVLEHLPHLVFDSRRGLLNGRLHHGFLLLDELKDMVLTVVCTIGVRRDRRLVDVNLINFLSLLVAIIIFVIFVGDVYFRHLRLSVVPAHDSASRVPGAGGLAKIASH